MPQLKYLMTRLAAENKFQKKKWMTRKKHELMVEGDSKGKGQQLKRSRFSHSCTSSRDKVLPPVKGV